MRRFRHQLAFPDQITVNHVLKPVLLLAILGLGAIYWIVSTIRLMATRQKGEMLRASRHAPNLGAGNLLLFVRPGGFVFTPRL